MKSAWSVLHSKLKARVLPPVEAKFCTRLVSPVKIAPLFCVSPPKNPKIWHPLLYGKNTIKCTICETNTGEYTKFTLRLTDI